MERTGGKRPWLAALLGTFATGLGHLYLRRWRRGLAWFVAAIAVSYLFVPQEAAQALLSGGNADAVALAPVFAVSIVSIADAYIVARRSQVRAQQSAFEESLSAEAGPDADRTDDFTRGDDTTVTVADADGDATAEAHAASSATRADVLGDCPNCGKELDPDLDFCPWCTTRLDKPE